MKRKNLTPALLAAAAAMLVLAGCGKKEAPGTVSAVRPDPNPPVSAEEPVVPGVMPDPAAELAALKDEGEPAVPAEVAPPSEMPSGEMSPEPVITPAPTPKATPVPPPTIVTAPVPTPAPVETEVLRPGTYEGADGSVLTVNADGTCTLLTPVSGKVNGKSMSANLTFHGTVDKGVFSLDKVTYGALDLTAIAAAAGYTDAAPWEAVAEVLYNLG